MKKFISLSWLLFFSTFLFGHNLIVPKEYDNNEYAAKSTAFALILNSSSPAPTFKKIGGTSVRFRCMNVDKIDCRAASPRITATIKSLSLQAFDGATSQEVPLYSSRVYAESAGATQWRVCGAATGGTTWDESKLTKTTSGGKVNLKLDNIHHAKKFYFFTNRSNRGNNNSFMIVNIRQTCH